MAGFPIGDSVALSVLGVTDRLIVRTVTMSLLVEDIPRAVESIASLAKDMDGFVVSSHLSGEEESQSGHPHLSYALQPFLPFGLFLRHLRFRVTSPR